MKPPLWQCSSQLLVLAPFSSNDAEDENKHIHCMLTVTIAEVCCKKLDQMAFLSMLILSQARCSPNSSTGWILQIFHIFFDIEQSRRTKPSQCGCRSTPPEQSKRHQRQRLMRQRRLSTVESPKTYEKGKKTPARLKCRGLTTGPFASFYAGLKLSTPCRASRRRWPRNAVLY